MTIKHCLTIEDLWDSFKKYLESSHPGLTEDEVGQLHTAFHRLPFSVFWELQHLGPYTIDTVDTEVFQPITMGIALGLDIKTIHAFKSQRILLDWIEHYWTENNGHLV